MKAGREYARHRWEIADVAIDHPEEGDDGGLVRSDAIEVTHHHPALCGGQLLDCRDGFRQ